MSIADEFKTALAKLQQWPTWEWVDAEMLDRRHKVARRSVVVLDLPVPGLDYLQRRRELESTLDRTPSAGGVITWDRTVYVDDGVYFMDFCKFEKPFPFWETMQETNRKIGAPFFEGIVCKRLNSRYPIQLHSPETICASWVKYRFDQ